MATQSTAPDIVKIAVLKLGCIGAAPLLELIFDERAERQDLDVRAFTSGAKLDPEAAAGPITDTVAFAPDLALVVSPNATLPGPVAARAALRAAGILVIAIGDGPSRRAFQVKDDAGKWAIAPPPGVGFMVFPFDPMLGARREFLDPTEMALFNADIIKVLAATGAMRLIQDALAPVVEALHAGQSPELPALIATAEAAVAAGGFANPYAAAKAHAALVIAEAVAGVSTAACFRERDPARYVPQVAAAHEMLRAATRLADEAREIEKAGDSVLRTPHRSRGERLTKTALMSPPT